MDLRILPGNIASMIAAGEVVQRPASVVKELMENSVDAGADQVTVVVMDSGRTLIQVIDNGSGMNPDDAVLCFERHATSKIATAEDLNEILTFGFRGEALASIAAVSEVTLKTRTEGEELGCQVEFAASEHLATSETATPKGTNISVRNLFYNVPARRKFLKSDNVEFRRVVEEFTRVALTRPSIGFTLTHNGRDIFVLKPAKSLKFRIMDLLGSTVARDIVDIHAETSVVRLTGFVGRPDAAKKTLGNQYFFINGRYFRSPYLHKAVMKAYEGLITDGVTPAYFLYLEVDPHSVDVNISPTKSEVKFEDDTFVFQVLFASIKETLGKNSFAGDIDFNNPEAKDMPVFGSHFGAYKPEEAPRIPIDPDYNPFAPPFGFGEPGEDSSGASLKGGGSPVYSGMIDRREDYGKLFEEKTLPSTQVIVLGGKYILAPIRSGLMVVNIRRARERILYDRALAALTKNEHVTQMNMFPVRVQVGVENRTIFDDHMSLLTSLGFDISPFGNDTIVVNGVPEGYSGEAGKVQTMVADLLLILSDTSAFLPGMMESSMAEKFAMLGSVNEAAVSSPQDAQRLLDALLACDNSEITASGRKIMTILTLEQVEKLI
jgi:DNA mismatch repair protein MutL